MYRRYYRYNDPSPNMRRNTPAPTPAPMPTPPAQQSKSPTFPLSLENFLGDTAKDDLILAGILLLLLLGEDKTEIDLPLVLALLYLLLRK